MMFIPFTRKNFVAIRQITLFFMALLLTLSMNILGCTTQGGQQQTDSSGIKTKVVRVGYQKSATLIKTEGVLEKRLAPLEVSVEWIEFPAGLPLLEALNVGSVDIGSTGDSPPIFAQAAGADLAYVATTVPNGGMRAILVLQDSPIQEVSDLKGKKVAIQKGSGTHYFLLKAIEKAGLNEQDVKFIYLSPSDGRAAFQQKKVDAWATWDPYYALAERDLQVRVIETGDNYATQGSFYLASKAFIKDNPEATKILLEEIQKLNQWADANPKKVAEILSPQLGIERSVMEVIQNRQKNGFIPIDESVIQRQQQIADEFYRLKLIPKKINVRDAMLTPEQYAAITPKSLS